MTTADPRWLKARQRLDERHSEAPVNESWSLEELIEYTERLDRQKPTNGEV